MPAQNISKDTLLCVSIAQHPSNFGTTLFNEAFAHEGIDAIYKALRVQPHALKDAVAGIRALGIRGCGVSMPFKSAVLSQLDSVDSQARKIGAVNTIVNTRGRLKGHNTDYVGARHVLAPLGRWRERRVVLLGAGGVAQAISAALQSLGARNVTVMSKNIAEARALARKWKFSAVERWEKRNQLNGDLLINATPLGMAPKRQSMPVSRRAISQYSVIMDVVINPFETSLLNEAKKRGKTCIPGYTMSLHQAARQFELYTGRKAPLKIMEAAMKKVHNP